MVTAVRRLRVSVDYGAFPVWDLDDGGMVDPEMLPIDASMVARLQQWADRFDATPDGADPAASKTPSRAWAAEIPLGWAGARSGPAGPARPAYKVRFGDDPVT